MSNINKAYTVVEFTTEIVPMSKSLFYTEVKSGRLETLSIGRRRYVTTEQVSKYLNSLAGNIGGRHVSD
jgi:hypothetical protein